MICDFLRSRPYILCCVLLCLTATDVRCQIRVDRELNLPALWKTNSISGSDVAVSPDGQLIAGTGFGQVLIFDAKSGETLNTLMASPYNDWYPKELNQSLSWTADGEFLAFVSEGAGLFVWNARTWELAFHKPDFNRNMSCLETGLAGGFLATATEDGSVSVYSLPTFEPVVEVLNVANWVTSMSFDSRDSTLLFADKLMDIHKIDIREREYQGRVLNLQGANITELQFANQTSVYAYSDNERYLRFSSGSSDAIAVHDGITDFAWSENDHLVAIARKSGKVGLYNVSSQQLVKDIEDAVEMESLDWNYATNKVVVAKHGQILVIDPVKFEVELEISGPIYSVHDVAWHPNGQLLAHACSDGVVRIIDPASGKTMSEYNWHETGIGPIAFSPSGASIASYAQDSLFVHAFPSGEREASIHISSVAGPKDLRISKLQYTGDGRFLVCQNFSKKLIVIDVETGKWATDKLFGPTGIGERSRSFDILHSANQIVHVEHGYDFVHKLYEEGTKWDNLNSTQTEIVRWTRDPFRFLSGGSEGRLEMFDWGSQAIIHKFIGHQSQLVEIDTELHSGTIASVDEEGKLILWRNNNGCWQYIHGNACYSIAFSPNGRYLATAGEDFSTAVWDVNSITSLESEKQADSFSVHWNTQSNVLELEFPLEIQGTLEIFDLHGKLLCSKSVHGRYGQASLQNVPNQIVLVRVFSDTMNFQTQIVKVD